MRTVPLPGPWAVFYPASHGQAGGALRTPGGAGVTAVTVRRAGEEDWPVVRQVRLAALADAPEAFASTLAREAALDEAEWRRRVSGTPWFLAWRDGAPEGLAAVLVPQDTGAGGAGWHLISMWVSPGLRGSGAAGLLVGAVAAHVREAGGNLLTLWVADGNTRARRFYRRCGFAPTGARQRYLRQDGTPLDEEELAMDLGEAPGRETA